MSQLPPYTDPHGLAPVGVFTRRRFLAATGAVALGAGLPAFADSPRTPPPPRPKPPTKRLAVVTTAYHYLSHAYHICGRFFNGYLRDGGYHYPDFGVAGMYV